MGREFKILQVSTSDRAGGAESCAWALFQLYARLGHKSWLAVGTQQSQVTGVLRIPHERYRSPWARLWIPYLKPPDYCSHSPEAHLQSLLRLISEPRRVLARRRGEEDFDFPGTVHLLDLVPEVPDVIHCHNLHGGYFDLRALPRLTHMRPLILNLHDAWLLSGHCAHSFDCSRWKTGCGYCPNLTTYPAIRRDATAFNWERKRHIYATSHIYVAAVSKWLIGKVEASMLQGVKSRVIYNGIDIDTFLPGSQAEARHALGLPISAKIVLFTAHNEYKDYPTMLAAIQRLERVNGNELCFVCLGQSGIEQVAGNGRLIFPGRETEPARMVNYYRATDVFLHAAREDSFPKTITEALACATPVVATAVGGIPEQIQEGETGYLTPRGDAQALAEAIQRLLQDSNLRNKMGAAGRRDAVQRFSLKRQVSEFLDWYGEVIEDWEARHGSHPT